MSQATILADLTVLADPVRAANSLRFFKTGPGEYGEGDQFLGLTVPQVRSIVKRYYRTLPLTDTIKLLRSPLHEARLTATLILVAKYQHKVEQDKIYTIYLDNTHWINNWDLVDSSAHKIVGDYLLSRPRDILYTLARSNLLWERRISIISTLAFIAKNDLKDAITISTILLHDTHDLIHKAVGWVLREVGKKDESVLRKFLDHYTPAMPRTMFRYSIEKLDPASRKHYLALR